MSEPYNPKYGDRVICECGHPYVDHFNLRTMKSWGCFWSYNCDCKEFKVKMGAVYVSNCCGKDVEDKYAEYPIEWMLIYLCRGCEEQCTPVEGKSTQGGEHEEES